MHRLASCTAVVQHNDMVTEKPADLLTIFAQESVHSLQAAVHRQQLIVPHHASQASQARNLLCWRLLVVCFSR
jgi:hypothetical protein